MIHGPTNTGDIRTALAKDLLRKIMTTPCDSGGHVKFDRDEVNWAMAVASDKPEWAKDTLTSLGFQCSET